VRVFSSENAHVVAKRSQVANARNAESGGSARYSDQREEIVVLQKSPLSFTKYSLSQVSHLIQQHELSWNRGSDATLAECVYTQAQKPHARLKQWTRMRTQWDQTSHSAKVSSLRVV
jgi:hypothetical protein